MSSPDAAPRTPARRGPRRGFVLAALASLLATTGVLATLLAGQQPSKPRPLAPEPRLQDLGARLQHLHRTLGRPRPGDWRAGPGRDELGQSYAQWSSANPVLARGKRSVLYLQVVGRLNEAESRIVALAEEFLSIYFGLKVKRLSPTAVDDDWPYYARRNDQLLSTYVLHHVLKPRLPADAAALIGFTAWDLWPGRGWNFVFGQASLHDRVGVWSMARYGDPRAGPEAWKRCLRRTLKVATHETGHMFTVEHCIAYACNMCGSNSLEEADRQPIALCPECLPKICHATGVAPRARFAALAAYCERNGLLREARAYRQAHQALAASAPAEARAEKQADGGDVAPDLPAATAPAPRSPSPRSPSPRSPSPRSPSDE